MRVQNSEIFSSSVENKMSKRKHGERVLCTACDKVMDEDYFQSHSENVHPSLPNVKFKFVEDKSQKKLTFFFSKKEENPKVGGIKSPECSSFQQLSQQSSAVVGADSEEISKSIKRQPEALKFSPKSDLPMLEPQENYSWINKWSQKKGGKDCRQVVNCKLCVKYPVLVKLHSGRFPGICTEEGVVFRSTTVTKHSLSAEHLACVQKEKAELAKKLGLKTETGFEKSFRLVNSEKQRKIGKIMIDVYNDAKRGTLSAWSYPSRYISRLIGDQLDLSQPHQNFIPSESDLSYIHPGKHKEFLFTISEVEKKQRLSRPMPLAISLRCDGAVDRTNVDCKHVMMKVVLDSGEERTTYLGFSESEERGAKGLFDAVKAGAEVSGYTWDGPKGLFAQVSSICTDGENSNTGCKQSLWQFLQRARDSSENRNLPLVKIWCAVHRSQLAFKSMRKAVAEIPLLLNECQSVNTFYNTSATRMKHLRKVADEMGRTAHQYTSVNDIRFTEYSETLIACVLRNYGPMVKHLNKEANEQKCAEAQGLINIWTDLDTIKLTTFLCDVLTEFKSFQKSIQSDLLTVFQLESMRDSYVSRIRELKTEPRKGGFEEKILELESAGEKYFAFDGVKLTSKKKRKARVKHMLVTSGIRSAAAIKSEIVDSLITFLLDRLCVEKGIGEKSLAKLLFALSPDALQHGSATVTQIEEAHSILASDLDKADFVSTYQDVVAYLHQSEGRIRVRTLPEILRFTLAHDSWKPMSTVLARVIAAKPHSCDVERLVSAYNLFKDTDRSSLGANTLDAYLNVRINMPPLAEFDVRPAVNQWFSEKSRRDKPTEKAMSQDWFKGVFREANQNSISKL